MASSENVLALLDMYADGGLKYYVAKVESMVSELEEAPPFLTEGEYQIDKSIAILEQLVARLWALKASYEAKKPETMRVPRLGSEPS